MTIYLVTYDLKQPGRNYAPVFEYLKRYTHCKGMESVWLLDTSPGSEVGIRDGMNALVDSNDKVFVTRLHDRTWASFNYACAEWLNDTKRSW